ncbi:hypothetical protein QRB32_27585 [Mycobacterium intracellulare subsp. chimaera]|uniref:hypothetical protein n=1 Tax=Mycobacterium intracellulare TaxID=1767 RepID=UPI00259BB468|nr:hypothetical protein [Mycobacterium intracellulare]MDM3935915.1 hypothetical protein [Mycobacterium intracellulare subsp. chimaera]
MTTIRNFAVAAAALAAVASASLASPSQADDLNGLYNAHFDASKKGVDAHDEQWVLTPCGTECLRIEHRVESVWDTQAHLSGTTWTTPGITTQEHCNDGSEYPLTSTYSFDAATLQGTASRSWPVSCGEVAGTDTQHLTLTKA